MSVSILNWYRYLQLYHNHMTTGSYTLLQCALMWLSWRHIYVYLCDNYVNVNNCINVLIILSVLMWSFDWHFFSHITVIIILTLLSVIVIVMQLYKLMWLWYQMFLSVLIYYQFYASIYLKVKISQMLTYALML